GRRLRLERERAGFFTVSFGRGSQNPAWVEDLWRTDRVRYWTTAAMLAPVSAAAMWWLAPRLSWPDRWDHDLGLPAMAATLWTMTVSFSSGAFQSAARLRRARTAEPHAQRGGSLFWDAAL